jgi:hypothetical protein
LHCFLIDHITPLQPATPRLRGCAIITIPPVPDLVRNTKANSDDEIDPQDGHYVIKRRVKRSVQAETLVRRLDDLRHSRIFEEGGQWRGRHRKVIPNQPFPATKGYAYRLPLSGLLQPPVQYSANNFAYASIVALSPDPAQISSNGRKHPDENLSDESFFDEYSEGILAQYIENLDLEDDQEEVSSQDG